MADKPASAWFGAGNMGWPIVRLKTVAATRNVRLGSTQLGRG